MTIGILCVSWISQYMVVRFHDSKVFWRDYDTLPEPFYELKYQGDLEYARRDCA